MHFVDCGDEPASLAPLVQYNANGAPIWDTTGTAGSDFFRDLGRPFQYLCGYCEKPCKRGRPGKPDSGEVDHFRPRSRYSKLTFEWENLVYACHRCNWKKADQFPDGEEDNSRLDKLKEQLGSLNSLSQLEQAWRVKERIDDTERSDSEIKDFERKFPNKKFAHPPEADGYVNPRDRAEKAEIFFVFDSRGEILPNPDLDNRKWSMAVRMICDLDLNGDSVVNAGRAVAFAYGKDFASILVRKPSERGKLARKLRRSPGRFPKKPGERRRRYPSCSTWAFFNALNQS